MKLQKALDSIVRFDEKIEHLLTGKATRLESGSQKQADFINNCIRAITNAAEKHGMDKYELAESLKDGSDLDTALMDRDDINMKLSALQDVIDYCNERSKELDRLKFELEAHNAI